MAASVCYPVTVAQFRAFVEAAGFEPGDPGALRDPDSRPVRYVDWHEALGYCEWLNLMLATAPVLDACGAARLVRSGAWQVGLPSELEWEKAARGGRQNAIFSWSDTIDPNRANYTESEIGDTSAVGCFPADGFGLHDMIGNLWEWTRSLWGKDLAKPDCVYPYDPKDGKRERLDAGKGVLRVVRGGSWLSRRRDARCAYRDRRQPGRRGGNLGFRVVLRPPPVPQLDTLVPLDSGALVLRTLEVVRGSLPPPRAARYPPRRLEPSQIARSGMGCPANTCSRSPQVSA